VALADFTAIDVMWICLSVFLAVVGVTLAFLLVRLAGSASRLTALLKGLEETVPPVLEKAGGTVDRVNLQLDKVDIVTDSAVGAADAADTAVRAVSMAITKPVTLTEEHGNAEATGAEIKTAAIAQAPSTTRHARGRPVCRSVTLWTSSSAPARIVL